MGSDYTRNLWIDYAKAIGIILVVYGHVARGIFNAGINIDQSIFTKIDSVIYSFHMPLFFFLSGMLFLASMVKRGPINLLRTKVDTIIYPYVIWSLLQGLLEVSLSQHVNGHPTISSVLSFAWSPRAQFWFLYVLFFSLTFAMLLYRRSNYLWCTGVFLGSVFLYFIPSQLPNVYLIQMLAKYFVYFAAGVLGAFLLNRITISKQKWLLLFLAFFVFSQWLFNVEMGSRHDRLGATESLLLGLIGIGFVLLLSQWLTRFNLRWMAYLGRHSMTIYLVHVIAGSGCRIILQQVFGITDVGIHLLLGTLGGLLLPLVFFYVCAHFNLEILFRPPKLKSAR